MALTQDEWFQKLKSFVPSWVFERAVNNVAVFKGMAKLLERLQLDYEQHIRETYIDTGSDDYVAFHGKERSVFRFPGETLSAYRQRVKRIVNQSNKPAIKSLVDSLLIRGECTILEHTEFSGAFFDRGFYLNRNIIDYQVLYNAFTILIDYQIPEPTSFYDRGSFLDREFLSGSSVSVDQVFFDIIKAVNTNKAYGTVYRLIERGNYE